MDLEKYKKIFTQESARYLEELNTTLIRVEKDVLNRGLWSDIHGKIHSIKGMARALNLETVSGLCHSMETWCREFQGGSISPTTDAVQVLMDGAELLKGLVAATSENAAFEGSSQLKRIEALLTKRPDEPIHLAPPDTRSISAPSKIDRIRIEYSLIEELLARSQEIILLEKTLPPLSHGQISSGLRSWIDHYMSMLRSLHFQLSRLMLMPVEDFVSLFDKTLRDLARTYNREVTLEIVGGELQVDIGLMERLREPFLHLLRNAIAHGIEPPDERERNGKSRQGKILFHADKSGDSLVLTISDDGGGIDQRAIERYLRDTIGMPDQEISAIPRDDEFLQTILRVGYSSAGETTQLAGRGIGMDVIAKAIEYLSGSMTIQSEPGKGTSFVIKLPLSLSIVYAIVFRLGPYTLSVPTSYVASIEKIEPTSSKPTGALYDLTGRLRIHPNSTNPTHILKLRSPLSSKGEPAAQTHAPLPVDAIVGNMPLMVMPSGELLSRARSFAGVGIMENGDISILLDIAKL